MGSVVYDNFFFSEGLGFNSVYKPHPNFGGYILVHKSAAYTRTNAVCIHFIL
jgi:hypothetical protein